MIFMVLVLAVSSGFLVELSRAADATLTERAAGADVVEATVDKITRACVFTDDKRLLRRIAFVASGDGRRRDTWFKLIDGVPTPYYGGIWAVNEDKFIETKDTSSHASLTNLHKAILTAFGIDWAQVTWQDLLKPMFSALAARLRLVMSDQTIPWQMEEQAQFWASHINTGFSKNAGTFISMVTVLERTSCSAPRADIVFVLDGSTSVSEPNFIKIRTFVANVTNYFSISKDETRVGVITFSRLIKEPINLQQYYSKTDLINAINAVPYVGGSTDSARALMALLDMFAIYGRDVSTGTPRIGVFVTDGKSNSYNDTRAAAEMVRNDTSGILMFAVGVTSSIRKEELDDIASEPKCTHVFELPAFTDVSGLVQGIQSMACKAPAFLAPQTTIVSSLKENEVQFYSVRASPTGTTLKMTALSGTVDGFTSYQTANPNEALHDQRFSTESMAAVGGEFFVPPPPSSGSNTRRKRSTPPQKLYLSVKGTSEGLNSFRLTAQSGDTRIFNTKSKAPCLEPGIYLVILSLITRTFL